MQRSLTPTPQAVSSDAFYFEKDKSGSILVMGVGNYLMGDEGVGVRVIEELARRPLPEYLDLLDGGTGGFLLLDRFQAYGTVVFVDATMDGAPPGTLNITRPRFASDFPSALSVHDLGLKDMIEAVYLLEQKPDLYLLTISIGGIEPMSVELSEDVAFAVPGAAARLLELGRALHLETSRLGGDV
jgi:hydrogenase maturation protease